MLVYIHILTDSARLVDDDGQQFADLADDARQSARELMAQELQVGRLLALPWRVQVADADGRILETIPFAEIAFDNGAASSRAKSSNVGAD